MSASTPTPSATCSPYYNSSGSSSFPTYLPVRHERDTNGHENESDANSEVLNAAVHRRLLTLATHLTAHVETSDRAPVPPHFKFVIVGAGIGGLVQAIRLIDAGYVSY